MPTNRKRPEWKLDSHGWECTNIFVKGGRVWKRGPFSCVLMYDGRIVRDNRPMLFPMRFPAQWRTAWTANGYLRAV